MNVRLNIRGIEEWKEYLKALPRGTVRIGMRAIAEWIIGTPTRGLKNYQPYKYVPLRKAGGFKSEKQRRYVMAAIREGRIDPGVPHRTGRTQRGWHIVEGSGGYRVSIQNPEPGAYYTRHDTGQARLNALAGWRKMSDIVLTNIDGALRHAAAKIREYLGSR